MRKYILLIPLYFLFLSIPSYSENSVSLRFVPTLGTAIDISQTVVQEREQQSQAVVQTQQQTPTVVETQPIEQQTAETPASQSSQAETSAVEERTHVTPEKARNTLILISVICFAVTIGLSFIAGKKRDKIAGFK